MQLKLLFMVPGVLLGLFWLRQKVDEQGRLSMSASIRSGLWLGPSSIWIRLQILTRLSWPGTWQPPGRTEPHSMMKPGLKEPEGGWRTQHTRMRGKWLTDLCDTTGIMIIRIN